MSEFQNYPNRERAIAVVDPFSTGADLAMEINKLGLKCVQILSMLDSPISGLVLSDVKIDFCATVQHNDKAEDQDKAINETAKQLRDLPYNLIAVIPGAEPGVELADQLSYRMHLRSNGIAKSLARRNKYLMGEFVRNAGLRAVKQAKCTKIQEVDAFLQTLVLPGQDLSSLRCVVKPVQSAGTDDVFLCSNADEAREAFGKIIGKVNNVGVWNDSVLVQEFLVGKEYVVDTISRDGAHKIATLWEYDKRPCNGSSFVYFGMKLRPTNTPQAKALIEYAGRVLDALDIKHGPSHMEVMLNSFEEPNGAIRYEPCLVEVGARVHGAEGSWVPVVNECIGYSQVTLTIDVYLDGILFNSIGKDSYLLKKAGRSIDLVSRYSGVVRSLAGDRFIKNLPSYRKVNWEVKPGDFVHKTIDCYTRPGMVQLVADTEEEVERDTEAIHELELTGLLELEN